MGKKGRIPATKVMSIRIIRSDAFYPLVRCDGCWHKWKMKMTDVESGEITKRSCKDNCVYARGVRVI